MEIDEQKKYIGSQALYHHHIWNLLNVHAFIACNLKQKGDKMYLIFA